MHRLIFTILAIGYFNLGFAQNLEVPRLTLQDAFSIPKTERIESISNTRGGSAVILTTQGENIFLRPINPTTGLPIRLLSIRSNDSKKVRRHKLHGDSLHCLIKSIEKDKSVSYESVIYSLENDQLAEAHRHVVGFDRRVDKKNVQPINFAISNNGKFSVVCRQFPYRKGQDAQVFVELTAYPEEESKVYNIPIPFESDDATLTGVFVSNSGVIYFGVKSGIKLNSPFLRKYLVYSFNPEANSLDEWDTSIDKLFTQSVILKMHQNKLRVIALFSSDPFKQEESSGFTYFKLNEFGTKIIEKKVHQFDPSTVIRLSEEVESTNTIENLFIQDILHWSRGELAILDQRYLDQICTTDPRTGIVTCTDQFHYDGILLESFSGTTTSTILGRRQVSYNASGPHLGHQAYVIEDQILVLYNDHAKNTGTVADKSMNNPSRSQLRYAVLNSDHLVHSEIFPSQNNFALLTDTKGFYKGRDLILLFSNGKEFKVGTIDTSRL